MYVRMFVYLHIHSSKMCQFIRFPCLQPMWKQLHILYGCLHYLTQPRSWICGPPTHFLRAPESELCKSTRLDPRLPAVHFWCLLSCIRAMKSMKQWHIGSKRHFIFFLSYRQVCKMKHMFKNRFKQIILRNPNVFFPFLLNEDHATKKTHLTQNKRAEPPSMCGSCPLQPWRNTPFCGVPPRHMKHKGVAKNISLRNGGLLITRFSQGGKRNGGWVFLFSFSGYSGCWHGGAWQKSAIQQFITSKNKTRKESEYLVRLIVLYW